MGAALALVAMCHLLCPDGSQIQCPDGRGLLRPSCLCIPLAGFCARSAGNCKACARVQKVDYTSDTPWPSQVARNSEDAAYECSAGLSPSSAYQSACLCLCFRVWGLGFRISGSMDSIVFEPASQHGFGCTYPASAAQTSSAGTWASPQEARSFRCTPPRRRSLARRKKAPSSVHVRWY